MKNHQADCVYAYKSFICYKHDCHLNKVIGWKLFWKLKGNGCFISDCRILNHKMRGAAAICIKFITFMLSWCIQFQIIFKALPSHTHWSANIWSANGNIHCSLQPNGSSGTHRQIHKKKQRKKYCYYWIPFHCSLSELVPPWKLFNSLE